MWRTPPPHVAPPPRRLAGRRLAASATPAGPRRWNTCSTRASERNGPGSIAGGTPTPLRRENKRSTLLPIGRSGTRRKGEADGQTGRALRGHRDGLDAAPQVL